jgi:hypothetical protein
MKPIKNYSKREGLRKGGEFDQNTIYACMEIPQ